MAGRIINIALLISTLGVLLISCEEFYNPNQGLVIKMEDYYQDWNEYRSAEMGLYYLQQNLVDQIVILGELRADLMEITPNADRDLREVYNFRITRDNKFASPQNFYKLIGASNSLINKLESAHSEVLQKDKSVNDYDRLYGEVKCMRAWAYFNAVRIFGKVPYIWPSLTTVNEIDEYVNTPRDYIDSVNITYDPSGYYNDTSYHMPVHLDRAFLDLSQVVDTFTYELENDIKAVGVVHNRDNNDATWDVTVWNSYAHKCLLGQMYLQLGDLYQAADNFRPILYNDDSESSALKFGLDYRFSEGRWRNIFSSIDGFEHIYTLWFNKAYQQQHNLQTYFSKVTPNQYMIKPTRIAIHNWETIWDGMMYKRGETNPDKMTMERLGVPGDFHRGHGISFAYMKGEEIMKSEDLRLMLDFKRRRLNKEVERIMSGVDTVLYKYTYRKTPFDQDADFIVYRAASIHLYFAEIHARWQFYDDSKDLIKWELTKALNIVNNGSYANRVEQRGVRGRVGFGGERAPQSDQNEDDEIKLSNTIFQHDPFTNQITGYLDLSNSFEAKMEYLEDQIIEERAREMAYEGERFYDLMRIAKRRDDPSYLADKIARKFNGSRKEEIRNLLMDESNWYIKFYE